MTIYATAIVLIAVCAGREATSHGVRRRLQSVTADELAANNSPVSCWIQIDDDAYDVTSYAKDHPGGPDAITKSCGQDVTEKFYANLAHSAPLLQFGPILKGPVVAASPAVQIFQSEVASHDNADSCWLHIGNNAYDVTAYAGSHPGGDTAIQKFCGQEITDIYYAVVSHTESGLVLAVDKGTVVANPVVVASPTPAPTEVPVGGGDLCFSGENTIEIMGKGRVTIDSIKIGDSVRVGPGGNDFSQVYSFGHYDVNIFTEYVQIHAEGSKSPLELSKEHMVFLQEGSISKSVPASAVKVGDKLIVITNGGGVAVVGKIGSVTRRGAFAPFTKAGTIVASYYISLMDETPVSPCNGWLTPSTLLTAWFALLASRSARTKPIPTVSPTGSTILSDLVSGWLYGLHRLLLRFPSKPTACLKL